MKVLVTGVGGQLGYDVACELLRRGHVVYGSDVSLEPPKALDGPAEMLYDCSYVPLDITDEEQVKTCISSIKPDAVVHCAAWTAVDAAEEPENNDIVRRVNVDGTRYIAQACASVDAKMVYISTDYVFDGAGVDPWDPDCKDYAPINVYGQSKLDGELAVAEALEKFFIVRIAWVFGRNGSNFVKTMLRVGKTHKELRVVNDQIGTPTYTFDLARLLVDMVETNRFGYYHATNEGGFISWAEFASEIFRQAAEKWPEAGYEDVFVTSVSTEEYGLSKAARPFNSRLSKEKLSQYGFEHLPDWKDALSRYLDQLDLNEL